MSPLLRCLLAWALVLPGLALGQDEAPSSSSKKKPTTATAPAQNPRPGSATPSPFPPGVLDPLVLPPGLAGSTGGSVPGATGPAAPKPGEVPVKALAKDPDGRADQNVKQFCKDVPKECSKAEALLKEARELSKSMAALKGSDHSLADYDKLIKQRGQFNDRLLDFEMKSKGDLLWVYSLVSNANSDLLKGKKGAVDNALGGLETRLKSLEAETKALEKVIPTGSGRAEALARVRALGLTGAQAADSFLDISLSIDHNGNASNPETMKLRDRANQDAVRLAQLRDRLITLQGTYQQPAAGRLDLAQLVKIYQDKTLNPLAPQLGKGSILNSLYQAGLPPGGGTSVVSGGGAGGPGKKDDPSLPFKLQPRSLLNAPGSAPPKPEGTGKKVDAPAIDPKGSILSLDAPQKLLGKKGDLAQADMLRRLGLTRTVGNPGGLAGVVHDQTGNTCAVVSQQEILQAYGMVSSKDPSKTEAELRDEATKKGYYDDGTPRQYSGDLLMDRGFILTKHVKSKPADLEAAVERGKPVIVSMDAGILWDNKRYLGGGHAIVVTGAEVNRVNGKVLGYYVNDSGSLEVGRGRFIPYDRFTKAWKARDSWFAEIR